MYSSQLFCECLDKALTFWKLYLLAVYLQLHHECINIHEIISLNQFHLPVSYCNDSPHLILVVASHIPTGMHWPVHANQRPSCYVKPPTAKAYNLSDEHHRLKLPSLEIEGG